MCFLRCWYTYPYTFTPTNSVISYLHMSSWVNPLLGSGGLGFGAGSHNPGAQVPFGILRLGPDTVQRVGNATVDLPFEHYGGYSYGDNTIVAFSHTHLVGAGVGDLGNFGMMPFSASGPHELASLISDHGAPLNHSLESASPGLYAIHFAGLAHVEVVASGTHSGSHQYSFTTSAHSTCGALLDVCHTAMGDGATACKNATVDVSYTAGYIEVAASMAMRGSLTKRALTGSVPLHFVARLDHASQMTASLWKAGAPLPDGTLHAAGDGSLGAILHGACTAIGALHVDVAISFISVEHARRNLAGQPHARSRLQTTDAWAAQMSVVDVESAASTDQALLTKFHTSVFHTYLAPSIYDENGDYMSFGSNSTLRTLQDDPADQRLAHAFTDMSLWDIHRTQLPWLSLTQPRVFRDVLGSLQAMAMQGSGDIPRWPLLNTYTGCMIGSHAWVTFAEAVAKNQSQGLNMTWLYESMVAGATTERPHSGRVSVANYTHWMFVPSEVHAQAASLTLSYAFDDAAVATVASSLGKRTEAAVFFNRSRAAYKLLWDPSRQLLCPRSVEQHRVVCPLDAALPYPFETRYTEGEHGTNPTGADFAELSSSPETSWRVVCHRTVSGVPSVWPPGDALQWLWFVPHDPSGLVALFPSGDAFVSKLHAFLHASMSIKQGGKWAGGSVLANGWYW